MADHGPIPDPSVGAVHHPDARAGVPTMRWGGLTHVGGVRDINEDAWFGNDDVCVVADGMGGHAAGEVASGLVVQLVSETFAAGRPDLADLPAFVSSLNSAVLRRGAENETRGMGTTMVAVAVIENGASPSAVVFHVGDSRCYRLRNGVLTQITRDHSHVQELVAAGRITPQEAVDHPLKNVITRALGAEVTVEADFHVLDDEDCRLLLCSDGLSGEIDDDLIWDVLTNVRDPDEAAQRLVDLTLEGPARDNVTVIVVDVDFPDESVDSAPTQLHAALSIDAATGEVITSERASVADVTAEPGAEATAEPSADITAEPAQWGPPTGGPAIPSAECLPEGVGDAPPWTPTHVESTNPTVDHPATPDPGDHQ